MHAEKPVIVVVVGAGVIGLTTAITVLEKRPDVQCYIVAEYMPGDKKTIEYTSPWAGAHHVSHSSNAEPDLAALEKETFGVLMNEYTQKLTDALKVIDQYEHYTIDADNGSNPEGLELCDMPGLRHLRPEELPEGFGSGLTFRTLTIDTPAYLNYLAIRFTRQGGRMHRAKLSSLSRVQRKLGLGNAPSVVVNCTGLGSMSLADVQDQALYPTRGQICMIRAPWMEYGKTFTGKGSTSYTIPRSSGLVIVGGTRDAGDWFGQTRPETTQLILERALAYDRNILPPEKRANGTVEDIDLVETGCGRRPSRRGGVRLELIRTGPWPIVHNYGHSGFGWQSSWGFGRKAAELVIEALLI